MMSRHYGKNGIDDKEEKKIVPKTKTIKKNRAIKCAYVMFGLLYRL